MTTTTESEERRRDAIDARKAMGDALDALQAQMPASNAIPKLREAMRALEVLDQNDGERIWRCTICNNEAQPIIVNGTEALIAKHDQWGRPLGPSRRAAWDDPETCTGRYGLLVAHEQCAIVGAGCESADAGSRWRSPALFAAHCDWHFRERHQERRQERERRRKHPNAELVESLNAAIQNLQGSAEELDAHAHESWRRELWFDRRLVVRSMVEELAKPFAQEWITQRAPAEWEPAPDLTPLVADLLAAFETSDDGRWIAASARRCLLYHARFFESCEDISVEDATKAAQELMTWAMEEVTEEGYSGSPWEFRRDDDRVLFWRRTPEEDLRRVRRHREAPSQ